MSARTFLSRAYRWLGIVPVLVLLFASTSPTAHAQGALLEVKVLRPAKLTVCLGESVSYLMELRRTAPLQQGDPPESLVRPILPGEIVSAESSDASVGEFTTS